MSVSSKTKQLIERYPSLTYQQFAAITTEQIRDEFPDARLSATFLKKVKALLLRHAESLEDANNLQRLKVQAWTWLQTNFPNVEVEVIRNRQHNKPCITLWLKGKPPELEDEI